MSQTISANELLRLLESDPAVQLVDVRSQDEYNGGHIPRALNIPLEEVERRLDDLGGRVVLVCRSGNRAAMACEQIHAHHPEVLILEGGTKAWQAVGNPITVSVRKARWSLERQVRFGAGILVLLSILLSLFVERNWVYLGAFVGAGLTFSGLTDICLMGTVLSKLPWNRPSVPRP